MRMNSRKVEEMGRRNTGKSEREKKNAVNVLKGKMNYRGNKRKR